MQDISSEKEAVELESNYILCLSFFDSILGPTVFYCSSPIGDNDFPDLGKILEFQDQEGDFIFAHRKYQTNNYIFYIDSELARGGKDLLMITYMIKAAYYKDEITDVYNYLQSKTTDLQEFASELKNLKGLPEVLHSQKNSFNRKNLLNKSSQPFKDEFLSIFKKYYEKVAPQGPFTTPLIRTENLKKIYIFGPKNSGRSTLLKNLEVIQFLQYKNERNKKDLVNKIYDFIIDNIEIMTYECIEDDLDNGSNLKYEDCLENAQAFILIFDASTKRSAQDAIDMFQIILHKCLDEGENFPVLIIANIFKKKDKLGLKIIEKNYDLEELANCGWNVKYLPINVLQEDQQIVQAIRWLIRQLI
jgi:hypothetical protein